MGKIEFKKIHNIVMNYLDKENDNELGFIGTWYFKFLKSNEEKLSLHVSFYTVEFTELAFTYIRAFTIVFNFLKQDRLTDFKDTCLFDIFNELPQTEINKLTLDFLKQKDNLALWGEDTLTELEEFLPVFNKEELIEFGKTETIKNTFKLFKKIRDSKIIEHPQLIKLKEKTLSFNNVNANLENELISENLFFIESNLDDDLAMELEDGLIEKNIKNRIWIKYPYSKKPHPYLMDVGNKRFKLIFNNRFAYNDILEEDIYTLQDEAEVSNQLEYRIIDTDHNKELYELFKKFKEQWINLELNKYTTPFPKYWFLFLNKSLSNEDWLIQFKKDFPAVAEMPIINIVKSIITEVIKIDWIKNEITNSTKILFPKLKSNRKKRLDFVFNSFKNHINTLNQNVEFITRIDSNDYENVIVLDSFNIIALVNKNQCNSNSVINIVVPDFLYFGYQPWIKFHLFNYQFTPLLDGLREELDDNYILNKEKIEDLRNKIVTEIKSELKTYKNKYKEETQIEDSLIGEETDASEDDMEFTNEEEVDNDDLIKEKKEKTALIKINQSLDNELTISSTEKILLQKDTLIYVKAIRLKIGDFIVRNRDVFSLFNANNLYDDLVNIPSSVINYQTELSENKNIYKILKQQGISYQHQNYFDGNYVKSESSEISFRIPRRKKDWAIICEFLNIDHSTQQLSFIAYYGRSKQNELKKMYKSVIDLLLKNNWIGTIEDPNIVASVSELVIQYKTIFNTDDTIEIREISESIISTILNQLKFTEIQTIKIIENE